MTEGILPERPKVILAIKTSINYILREKKLAFDIQSPGAKDWTTAIDESLFRGVAKTACTPNDLKWGSNLERDFILKLNLDSEIKLRNSVAAISDSQVKLGNQVGKISKEIFIYKINLSEECIQVKNLGSIIPAYGEHKEKLTALINFFCVGGKCPLKDVKEIMH